MPRRAARHDAAEAAPRAFLAALRAWRSGVAGIPAARSRHLDDRAGRIFVLAGAHHVGAGRCVRLPVGLRDPGAGDRAGPHVAQRRPVQLGQHPRRYGREPWPRAAAPPQRRPAARPSDGVAGRRPVSLDTVLERSRRRSLDLPPRHARGTARGAENGDVRGIAGVLGASGRPGGQRADAADRWRCWHSCHNHLPLRGPLLAAQLLRGRTPVHP
mmetsp:Transcript_131583/g.420950  ORF Transcript_131583/g.420950 Transcript_131583/m.420950 type:complete len:214 (+) Transcript_131583:1015-1656(+)